MAYLTENVYCNCLDPITVGQGYFIPSIYSQYNLIYETQGKVQKFRPYIDSCAVGGLQSKRTQAKTYPSQNVPSWRQNLLK